MRWIMIMAAFIAAALPVAPAAAQAMPGLAARAARLHAGPLIAFPVVRDVRRGATVRVHGCLRDRSWCDVTYRTDRGWIPADALRISQRGQRSAVAANGDIEVTAFTFEPYWRSHYRGRRFYNQRQFWQSLYETDYQPAWGEREQQADERRGRHHWSSDPAPSGEGRQGEGRQGRAPLAPYAFPDHSLERVKPSDPAVSVPVPAFGSTVQEQSPDASAPARNPQP